MAPRLHFLQNEAKKLLLYLNRLEGDCLYSVPNCLMDFRHEPAFSPQVAEDLRHANSFGVGPPGMAALSEGCPTLSETSQVDSF